MANNTVLNPGAGGDTLRTDDVTTSKIPVSKIATGPAGTDGGVVTPANPFQVVIASGSQGVSVVGTSLSTMPQSGSVTGLLVGGVAVSQANPLPTQPQSGSVTGLLVGGAAVSQANPVPVTGSTGILIGGVQASLANPVPFTGSAGFLVGGVAIGQNNPAPVSGSVGIITAGAQVSAANPLSTKPVSGSLVSLMVNGLINTPANPIPTQPQSGSVTGLLIGGQPVNTANPVVVALANSSNLIAQSGSVTGLLVGGVPVSSANPMPVGSAWDQSGQMISGSIVRTVQYSFSDAISGSTNQVVPPQGTNNRIRLLSAQVMNPAVASLRWISTGSAGTITNVSALTTAPANGGFILPFNPHGWLQTNANEGLNAAVNMAGGATCGINITWIIVGP